MEKIHLQEKFPFFAFGLYNFARYLYREEVKNITLPQNEFYLRI